MRDPDFLAQARAARVAAVVRGNRRAALRAVASRGRCLRHTPAAFGAPSVFAVRDRGRARAGSRTSLPDTRGGVR